MSYRTIAGFSACNEFGVPLERLLSQEKARNARMEAKLRAALAKWAESENASAGKRKQKLLEEARALRTVALS